MSEATGQPAAGDDPVARALNALVRGLAHGRHEGGLSPGDHAELRRMDPLDAALPPVFWRLLTATEIVAAIEFTARGEREKAERAFAIVIQAIAEAGTSGSARIGRALAETGYAETRFVRLLRARSHGNDLAEIAFEARQAAHWCATKGATVHLIDFARFILDAALGRDGADRRAHAIARDYFVTTPTGAQSPATPET